MLRHAISPSRRFTKASHDVVRHPRLSSDAKILLLYVQGLPEDAPCRPLSELARKLGIKGRAYQKAKEQLVAHGYVHEWRTQGSRGRWITEQLVANTPLTIEQAAHLRGAPPTTAPPSAHIPTVGEPAARTVGGYKAVEDHSDKTTPHPPSEAEPATDPEPEPTSRPADSHQLACAERVLLSLRHTRRELHLGAREARALAVEAVKWLERGLSESDLRQALLAERPEDGVRSAFGFLRYRLIQKLPRPHPRPRRLNFRRRLPWSSAPRPVRNTSSAPWETRRNAHRAARPPHARPSTAPRHRSLIASRGANGSRRSG